MLSQSYHNHIVGLNYITLIKGIISLKQGHKTLITHDENLKFANQWFRNIGYSERSVLSNIGQQYDIDSLIEIDAFLEEQSSVLYLNQKLFEFSGSPYANIKEIARKLPECFSELYLERLSQVNPDRFDQRFFEFLDETAAKSFMQYQAYQLEELFLNPEKDDIEDVFRRFNSFIKTDKLIAKQLHYVIQVMFQTIFSSGMDDLETTYLFISLISPRFKVDESQLLDELLYEYRNLGGDLKQAKIQDWGIKDNRLSYVELNSVDGIVQVDHSFFFAQDHHLLPFRANRKRVSFKSIEIHCHLDHEFIHYFQNKRIAFAPQNRMGSDFPYWEVRVDETGKLTAIYSYAEYDGTKASFYYPSALDDIYSSLKTILPGLKKSDWVSRAKLQRGEDIWFEYEPRDKKFLSPDNDKNRSDLSFLYMPTHKAPLAGIENCGPDRGRSLGLFSYFLDIFTI